MASVLFEPTQFGSIDVKNRFVAAATMENMAEESGSVAEKLEHRIKQISKGRSGLVFPGMMYVNPLGRSFRCQTGIHTDDMIPGLSKLVSIAHEYEAKIIFQLAHAGAQTEEKLIGQKPLGPSRFRLKSYIFPDKCESMSEEQLAETIRDFAKAAFRAVEAGVDGLHLNAGAGYLLNQFLSPAFNKRKDIWGGSPQNRFRLLEHVVKAVRQNMPDSMPLSVKLNVDDSLSGGIKPDLGKQYVAWLLELGIQGLEITTGTTGYSFMSMERGLVPKQEFLAMLPKWMGPVARIVMRSWEKKYGLQEAWNLGFATDIRPMLDNTKLILVGGLRSLERMESIIANQQADFISMCRPLIREPDLILKFQEGKASQASCVSCNLCFANTRNQHVRCFHRS